MKHPPCYAPHPTHYFGWCNSVLDGDTLTCDVTTWPRVVVRAFPVRLFGIQAPERSRNDSLNWQASRNHLNFLCYGRILRLEPIEPVFEKHGRLLALVWREELCVNTEMVTRGMAVLWKPHLSNGPSHLPGITTPIRS